MVVLNVAGSQFINFESFHSLYKSFICKTCKTCLQAADADAVPSINYVIISGNTQGSDGFAFTVDGAGRIFSKNSLDFETKQFYQFLVTTTDGQNTGITSATATIQVTVLVRTVP